MKQYNSWDSGIFDIISLTTDSTLCISFFYSFIYSVRNQVSPLKEERKIKLTNLTLRRQPDVRVVLENVRDLHNVGAVIRTCDAVGIARLDMTLIDDWKPTDAKIGKHTSSGARKWVETHMFSDIDHFLQSLPDQHGPLLGAALDQGATSVYDLDLTKPVVLVFGNERDGLSDLAVNKMDELFYIPQMGMVQSLNISVACAVTLYEVLRQRHLAGMYESTTLDATKKRLLELYMDIHNQSGFGKQIIDHCEG